MLGLWNTVTRCVSSVVSNIKKRSARVWNAVTGKNLFLEAERLHNKIIKRYEEQRCDYEKAVSTKSQEIKHKLESINNFKKDIFKQQFPRFITLGNRLHNIRVAGSHFEEFFGDKILDIKQHTGVRDKKKLFKIDFNDLSFKELALSVLTLGIFSRKKAKESLLQVKDEEKRIEEEIEKMKAQLVKVDQILSSINNIVGYFDSLINNYSSLLDRFEYGINSQRVMQIGMNPELFQEKLNFRLLPIVHIEEFQALFNLSIVLKQMSQMSYLSQDGELVEREAENAQALFNKVQHAQAA